MPTAFLGTVIYQFSPQIPALILWLIGIGLSLYYWRKNPSKYLLTTISFSIHFLVGCINPLFATWMTMQLTENAISASQMSFGYQLFWCLSMPISVTASILLFIALFSPKHNTGDINNEPVND